MLAIRAEGLTKRFGAHLAVDGLDLEIAAGEVFGLLGPNGAGKTTTVRMLTALVAPTAGRAWTGGHAVGAADEAVRRVVGVLTETPGHYPRLTARENLRVHARLHEVRDIEGQVERYLRMLGLWERRDALTGGFSKGMKQKLAIARCLLHEPDVLFLDEPTAALDPTAAKVVRDFIAELKAQGRTIVLCTHNLDEAERLADRIGILSQRMLQVGRPAELRAGTGRGEVVVRLAAAPTEAQVAAVREVCGGGADAVRVDGVTLTMAVSEVARENPALVRALVGADADVVEVVAREATLEAVYFDLVGRAVATREEGAG